MLDILSDSKDLQRRFILWHEVMFSEWSDLAFRKEAEGSDVKTHLPQDETYDALLEYINEINSREGQTL